jgi:hypothetical protein
MKFPSKYIWLPIILMSVGAGFLSDAIIPNDGWFPTKLQWGIYLMGAAIIVILDKEK